MFNYNFLSILLEKNAIYLCTCVCCAKIEKAANYPPLHIHLSSPHRKYNNNDCDIKKKETKKKTKKEMEHRFSHFRSAVFILLVLLSLVMALTRALGFSAPKGTAVLQ